ncbi:unnamed protein product [Periconia digitata]|uniref:Uncharacterized protein n=1 Tax=Periconia digitata TaxID=1303443 RepID=A0A9W4UKG4_9PLEO|nr:unnamed protein product [Periconia digitata]
MWSLVASNPKVAFVDGFLTMDPFHSFPGVQVLYVDPSQCPILVLPSVEHYVGHSQKTHEARPFCLIWI